MPPTSRRRRGSAEICTAWAASVTRHRLPARDVEQAAGAPGFGLLGPPKNARGRAHRIEELLDGAPARARSLLEEAERVAVAVVEVAQARLLHGRGERDDDAVVGHAERAARPR